MTLSEILPSLAAASVERSFGPCTWGEHVSACGHDIRIGALSLTEALADRPTPFRVGDLLICRITAITAAPVSTGSSMGWPETGSPETGRRHLHIDADLGTDRVIDDIAFPGTCLAGARMGDVTIVECGGIRRTLHAELPRELGVGAAILLATASTSVPPRPRSVAHVAMAADV